MTDRLLSPGIGPLPERPVIATPEIAPPATLAEPSDTSQPYSPSWFRPRVERFVKRAEDYTCFPDARYRQAVGPYYVKGWHGSEETHSNWYWKFVYDMGPAMIGGELCFATGAADPDAMGEHAEALGLWLNRACKETKLQMELSQACDNMLWGPGGVLMVYPEDVPGTQSQRMASLGVTAPVLRARVKCLDTNVCFTDPDCEINESEIMGHREIIKRADILQEMEGSADGAGWNLDAVNQILSAQNGDGDAQELRKKTFNDGISGMSVQDDQMVVYRIWCRKTQMIHTLAFREIEGEKDGMELKAPARWRGHPRGPYVWCGVVWIRGHAYPMPLTAIAERLVREQDEHRKKDRQDAAAAKRNVAVIGKNAVKEFAKLRNGEAWNTDPSKIKEIETGGSQEATVQRINTLDMDLQEIFGLSSARMGNTGEGTATNTVVAEQALGAKKKLFVDRWKECVREVARRMSFIGWNLDQVETKIPVDGPDGSMVTAQYFGGVVEGDQADWMDVENEIDLEPFSLGAGDSVEKQETLDRVAAIVDELMLRVTTNPLAFKMGKWENWLDDRLRTAGITGGAKRYVDWAYINAYVETAGMAMLGGGMAPGAGVAGAVEGQGGIPSGPIATGPADPMGAARSMGASAGGKAKNAAAKGAA
jgi:hypothetical protein